MDFYFNAMNVNLGNFSIGVSYAAALIKYLNNDIEIKYSNKMSTDPMSLNIGFKENSAPSYRDEEQKWPIGIFGQFWSKYASFVLPEYKVQYIDRKFVQYVDKAEYNKFDPRTFEFNSRKPCWNEDYSLASAFADAIDDALASIRNLVTTALAEISANTEIEKLASEVSGNILILDKNIPWKSLVKTQYTNIKFVIEPNVAMEGQVILSIVPWDRKVLDRSVYKTGDDVPHCKFITKKGGMAFESIEDAKKAIDEIGEFKLFQIKSKNNSSDDEDSDD